MKRNENCWSYRSHKLGTPKVLRTDGRTDRRTDGRPDGRSGPTTRPAFAKATQVITVLFYDFLTMNEKFLLSLHVQHKDFPTSFSNYNHLSRAMGNVSSG